MISLKRTIAGFDVTVKTHDKPHLDEILALFLIENFATTEWVATRWENGSNNGLHLGISGGSFDEHPRDGSAGTKTECCATLVAKSLGQSDNPALTQLLKWIYNVDAKGAGHPFDLYNLVKMMNEVYPDDPERVITWAYEGLRAKYAEQIEFVASQEAVLLAGLISLNEDASLLLMVAETDHKSVAKAAVERLGGRYAAAVVRRSTGHVQVFTHKRIGIRAHEAVRLLRIAEFRQRKQNCTLTEPQLRGEGFVPDTSPWYYHANGELILNGSLTNSEVPPTRLPFSMVVSCVELGLTRSLPKPNKSVTYIQPLRV